MESLKRYNKFGIALSLSIGEDITLSIACSAWKLWPPNKFPFLSVTLHFGKSMMS